ncbi:hypothetical protein FB566_2204 [Stackebrandtia endophytica]|uniref:Uncharacterized protein n=1 Tax=Stackebrandtia endophytica TaxID=1496996 RepID=A0A543AVQ5_9ACTN|nr:hypothetical protein FB566_2204 [Stackebrandtia endophytica]
MLRLEPPQESAKIWAWSSADLADGKTDLFGAARKINQKNFGPPPMEQSGHTPTASLMAAPSGCSLLRAQCAQQ